MASGLLGRPAGRRALAHLLALSLCACGRGVDAPDVAAPVLQVAPASLSFTTSEGGPDPAAQEVQATGSGAGALALPTVTVGYGAGAGWLTATVSGAAAPFAIAVRPSTAGLAAGSYAATIAVASAGASGSPRIVAVALTVAPAEADPCAFTTPGARWLAYVSDQEAGAFHVRLRRADGACERAVTTGAGQELYPAFRPGAGGQLTYVAIGGGRQRLAVQAVEAASASTLDLGDVNASAPAYSRDGALLAFEATPLGGLDSDLQVIPADGGAPVTVAGTAASESGPAWGPGGELYFVRSDAAGGYDVWVTDVTGAAPTRVTTGAGVIGRPAVSADGTRLAYARRGPGQQPETVLLTLATGLLELVGAPGDADPAFDPDGGRLAVSSTRAGLADVHLLDLQGGPDVRVTDAPGTEGLPAYAP
ncbi:MAG: PD40 domain-containing protein [Anaeromyxobacter sp.]|nr:PD40 domain-containing protein [Anaeromyxobacter sp.]MBL0278069.1 PD40 domain-containing protein [Anaeromyxobacter sp.]